MLGLREWTTTLNDGFDPYYADPPAPDFGGGYVADGAAGGGFGMEADYSQPYGEAAAAAAGGGGAGAPGVAYEPAKPFDDDEPPF